MGDIPINQINIYNNIFKTMVDICMRIDNVDNVLVKITSNITTICDFYVAHNYNDAALNNLNDLYTKLINLCTEISDEGFLKNYCTLYMNCIVIGYILNNMLKNYALKQLPFFKNNVFVMLKFYYGRHALSNAINTLNTLNTIKHIREIIYFIKQRGTEKKIDNKTANGMIEDMNVLHDVSETSIEQYVGKINVIIQQYGSN